MDPDSTDGWELEHGNMGNTAVESAISDASWNTLQGSPPNRHC